MQDLKKAGLTSRIGVPVSGEIARDPSGPDQFNKDDVCRLIVEKAFEGIIVAQNDRVCFVNPRVSDLTGYTRDELSSMSGIDLVHPDDKKWAADRLNRRLNGENVENTYPVRFMTKEGEVKWVQATAIQISWEGQPAVLGFLTDISAQKQAEAALRESEMRYRKMVDSAVVGVYESDLSGNILDANGAMAKIFEWESPQEIIGKAADIAYKNIEDREAFVKIIHQQGFVENFECEFVTKTGKSRNAMVTGVLHGDKIYGTLMDITEQKKAEEALKKACDESESRVVERTKELKRRTRHLAEANTALKVLLKTRTEDKSKMEEKIITNVTELVMPYLEKIKKMTTHKKLQAYLNILEDNLNNIVAPFSNKLGAKYINLTSAEIEVADLVRHGKSTKEIAELLNVSIKTVETHRVNIRKKLGITNKKANLRTFLLSLG